MAKVSGYHPDMLIWVDETGSDRRHSIRSYGYVLRDMRSVCHHLSVGGRRVSAELKVYSLQPIMSMVNYLSISFVNVCFQ